MLASLNGTLRAQSGQGLTDIGAALQLLGVINPAQLEEETTNLTCYVVAAEINDGLVTSKAMAIETDVLEVYTTSSLDLGSEAIDLRFQIGEHDGVTAAEILSPLVQFVGTFSEPILQLEPGSSAVLILTQGWSLLVADFEELARADETICAASLRREGLLAEQELGSE